jgi:hypothetical protein
LDVQLHGFKKHIWFLCLLALLIGSVKITATTTPLSACLNNLRMIDGAKEQVALEKKLAEGTTVDPSEVIPYIKGRMLPQCSGGGTYSLGRIGEDSTCSISGHSWARAAREHEKSKRREAIIIVGITVAFVAVVWLITGAIVVGLRDRKESSRIENKLGGDGQRS